LVAFIDGRNLVRRHTSEHRVCPKGFLTGFGPEIDDFLRHSLEIDDIALKYLLPFEQWCKVSKGDDQENDDGPNVRNKLADVGVFHDDSGLSLCAEIKKEDNACYLLFESKIAKKGFDLVNRDKKNYSLSSFSSETVSFFLPLALLAAKTLRPLAVDMRSRNPCLFFLFLLEGWNVLFVIALIFFGTAKVGISSIFPKKV
jgi:hypothetical protein